MSCETPSVVRPRHVSSWQVPRTTFEVVTRKICKLQSAKSQDPDLRERLAVTQRAPTLGSEKPGS